MGQYPAPWGEGKRILPEGSQTVASTFGILKEDLVLDAGCGPGDVSQYGEADVVTHFQRANVVVDTNPAIVQFYRGSGLKVAVASVEALPFKDKVFDFVWCSHVLEHIDDPEKGCKELSRVGRRGRITTPERFWETFQPAKGHQWMVSLVEECLIFERKYAFLSGPAPVVWGKQAKGLLEWLKEKSIRWEVTLDWFEEIECRVIWEARDGTYKRTTDTICKCEMPPS